MADKNYIASSIKEFTTQYGTLINANLKLEDLQKIAKNGWVQITIAERKNPSVGCFKPGQAIGYHMRFRWNTCFIRRS